MKKQLMGMMLSLISIQAHGATVVLKAGESFQIGDTNVACVASAGQPAPTVPQSATYSNSDTLAIQVNYLASGLYSVSVMSWGSANYQTVPLNGGIFEVIYNSGASDRFGLKCIGGMSAGSYTTCNKVIVYRNSRAIAQLDRI